MSDRITFELFSDRLEITSAGGLPFGLSEDDFFAGHSSPRNKEIMRVFRDLEIVEHLGSGIPRILKAYGREAFQISANFMRLVFPYAEPIQPQQWAAGQVTPEVLRMAKVINGEMNRLEIMHRLGLKDEKHFREAYQQAGIALEVIEMTIPDKPRSSKQKYRLTAKGRTLLK